MENRVRHRFRSVKGVVVNFSVYAPKATSNLPVRSFVRHRYRGFLSFFLFLLLSLAHSLSLSPFSALTVFLFRFPGRETPDLLAAQIKIEQSTIKCKWGYWPPKPLRPVIDFHGTVPRFSTSRPRNLYYYYFFVCGRSRILRSAFYTPH